MKLMLYFARENVQVERLFVNDTQLQPDDCVANAGLLVDGVVIRGEGVMAAADGESKQPDDARVLTFKNVDGGLVELSVGSRETVGSVKRRLGIPAVRTCACVAAFANIFSITCLMTLYVCVMCLQDDFAVYLQVTGSDEHLDDDDRALSSYGDAWQGTVVINVVKL